MGCHFLLQGIFSTLKSSPGLLHGRQILYQLSYQGSHNGHYTLAKFTSREEPLSGGDGTWDATCGPPGTYTLWERGEELTKVV